MLSLVIRVQFLFLRTRNWFVWNARLDWRVVSMWIPRQSCCLSSGYAGKNCFGVLHSIAWWKSWYNGTYKIWSFRINAMPPQTKKILQLLRLRQVHSTPFLYLSKNTSKIWCLLVYKLLLISLHYSGCWKSTFEYVLGLKLFHLTVRLPV